MQTFTHLYFALVLNRPLLLLASLALLAALAGISARDFRLDASSDSLVVETDPDLAYFREMGDRYGSSSFLIVTYAPPGDLFADTSLATLQALRDDITAVEGVAGVLSMLDVPLLRSPPIPLTELATSIRTLSSPGTDRALARKELTSSPWYADLLVSRSGHATAMQIELAHDLRYANLLEARNALLAKRFDTKLNAAEEAQLDRVTAEFESYKRVAATRQRQLIADLRTAIAPYRSGALIHLGGVPMIADDMLHFVRDDLKTLGASVALLIAAMLAFFFRQPRWVLLPFAVSALVTLYMVGLLGALGWPVTIISSNFVSLLIIMSISLTVHLIVRFRELHHAQPEQTQRMLIQTVIEDKFWPCFYTALTTMVAFGSLVTSGIVPVTDFGRMMTLGMTVALAVTFLLFPAGLVLINREATSAGARKSSRHVHVVEALGCYIANKPWRTFVLSTVIAVTAGVGIPRLSVDSSFIDYFDATTEIHQGMTYMDTHFGGTTPLDVLVNFPELDPGLPADADDPFAAPFATTTDPGEVAAANALWFTPDKIALIEQVHAYLEAQPETGKVLSLATLHAIARSFNDDQPLSGPELVIAINAIPEALRATLLRPYAAPEANQARLAVRIIESSPDLKRNAFLERIRTHISEELESGPDAVQLTGFMVLFNNMLESLYDSQITTLLWVGIGILLTFILLFRSLLLGALALIPNVFAAIFILGIMGWVGLPLDMMTITIAAIIIGIGIDNSIHYVHRYSQEFVRSGNSAASLRASHASIGHAMYYTSITVIVGFSVLTLSNFNPTIYFGALTALSMAIALLANLTLLPAILILVRPRFRSRQL